MTASSLRVPRSVKSAKLLPEPHLVSARITDVYSEIGQARAVDAAGIEYALTRTTPGVDVSSLREGQNLRCRVEPEFGRILDATLVAGSGPRTGQ